MLKEDIYTQNTNWQLFVSSRCYWSPTAYRYTTLCQQDTLPPPTSRDVTARPSYGFYFEYIHYDDPFQFLETLSFINVASLANESLKNCLAPHIF